MDPVHALIDAALSAAFAAGAEEAVARFVTREAERVRVRNGEQEAQGARTEGLAVEAIHRGARGVSAVALSRADLDVEAAKTAAREAVGAAKATALLWPSAVALPPSTPGEGHAATGVGEDPFAVPLRRKLELVRAASAAIGRARGVSVALAQLRAVRTRATIGVRTKAGSRLHLRDETLVGAGARAVAGGIGRVVFRSAPAVGGGVWSGGFERCEAADLVGLGALVGEEAVALVAAPPCPRRTCDVVLDASLVGPLFYETLGRALEADAPSLFVPGDLGKTVVAAPALVVSSDPMSGPVAGLGVDDAGEAPRARTLLAGGVLRAFVADRAAARVRGVDPTGAARAADFAAPSGTHLGSLVLAPGAGGSLDALCAGVDDGLLLSGARAIVADPRRGAFRVVAERAWRIKGGKRAGLVRGATIGGTLGRFWQGCDGVGGLETAAAFGTWRRKGPGLPLAVSHRAVALRVRQVETYDIEGP